MKLNKNGQLITIALGAILNPLNSAMISIALPYIQKDFQLPYTTATWLISSYYLSSAIAQPVMGKISDQIGPRRLFLAGLILVAISALAAPWSTTFFALLLFRLFQSVGSSTLYPSGVSIIHRHAQGNQAYAMAFIATCTTTSAALGPTVGGFLVAWGGWPAIFTVNFPVLALSFLLGWFFLPPDPKPSKRSLDDTLRKVDFPGIVLFALAIAFFLWFLLSFESRPHPISGLVGLVFGIAFVLRELKVDHPFIDFHFFIKHPGLATVYMQFIVINIFYYSLFFGLPTYFQTTLHFDARYSGMLMLFISGWSALVSPSTGRWADRAGFCRPLLAGASCMTVGAILLTLFFTDASLTAIGITLSITGISFGIMNVALQAAVLKLSPSSMIGVSSGLFQTSRYFGSILSSVVLGLVFGNEISSGSLHQLGYVLIGLSIIVSLISFMLWMKEWKRKEPNP